LVELSNENKRLNQCIQEIIQEIEEKTPLLQKQREDYENAMNEIESLTSQLNQTNKAHQDALTKVYKIFFFFKFLKNETKFENFN